LVALDIDGTMIGEDRVVRPELIKAISDVQAMGAVVSIATGRTLIPALRVAEQSGVTGPVICFQGAMTFDQISESEIRHIRLDENIARRSIECLTSVTPEVMMFLGDEIWVEQRTAWTDGYGERMGIEIRNIDSLLSMADHMPTAIVGVGDSDVVGPLVVELKSKLRGSALVTHSLPMFCEIQAIGAGKDLALAHLARSLGIEQAAVIAVGDGKGDQSMVEWAGLGVAIEGGHDDVIRSSDQLIATPDNGGLVQFLRELTAGDKFVPPNGNNI
tara:strand:- start:21015 stop:21833 length:819 start_codon:yes stop_codon:yes gene_type:complete